MRVLVVNAGSSSLKVRMLSDSDELLGSVDVPADSSGFDPGELAAALKEWPAPEAVGHRVVHGGTEFSGPVRIDGEISGRLRDLTALAPLHQPKSLAGIEAVSAQLPDVPAVACFDTAFHTTLSPGAFTYPVPPEWRERYGVRRYGFHGLSHTYASRRAAELTGAPISQLRIVVAHLGAGASLCAVAGGVSVDTTMGFTPLEGLVMATRSGTVDPGLVLWLEQQQNLTPAEVSAALEKRSGLTALAGIPDMREIEQRAATGQDPRARLALDVYDHRLAGGIGSMIAAAGGLDVLVFTGGVGEHSAGVRSRAATRLGWAGVGLDPAANATADGDVEISGGDSRVRTFVVTAREDLQIAGEVRHLLG